MVAVVPVRCCDEDVVHDLEEVLVVVGGYARGGGIFCESLHGLRSIPGSIASLLVLFFWRIEDSRLLSVAQSPIPVAASQDPPNIHILPALLIPLHFSVLCLLPPSLLVRRHAL